MEENNNNTEKLSWNLSANKVNTIGGLIQRGESAWIEDDDVVKRYNCWQSIAVLIDNRLQPKHRKRLRDLQRLIKEKSYSKNKFINRWVSGSEEWKKNQFILNKTNMLLYSNIYIKYVNGLLRVIGMDIKSEDSSLGEID